MDTVHELQRKIRRLEYDLFKRDQEIIRAKFTILHALPQLNTPSNDDPSIDIVRAPGYLDPKMFEKACLERWLKNLYDDPVGYENRKKIAIAEAKLRCNQWGDKIRNGVWEPYMLGQMENLTLRDLTELKDEYGEELYNAVKVAWVEAKEGRVTGVNLKPWDYEARREKTLTELLQEHINFIMGNNNI